MELVVAFRKVPIEAVVLINTRDNYMLAPEFLEGMDVGSFPIVVMKKSDGLALFRMLECQIEVLARLDVEGMMQQHTKALFGFDHKSSFMSEMKGLMFSGGVVVSEDPARFTMVMSVFTSFEKQVCRFL